MRGGEVKMLEYEVDEDVYLRVEDVFFLVLILLWLSLLCVFFVVFIVLNRGILR